MSYVCDQWQTIQSSTGFVTVDVDTIHALTEDICQDCDCHLWHKDYEPLITGVLREVRLKGKFLGESDPMYERQASRRVSV